MHGIMKLKTITGTLNQLLLELQVIGHKVYGLKQDILDVDMLYAVQAVHGVMNIQTGSILFVNIYLEEIMVLLNHIHQHQHQLNAQNVKMIEVDVYRHQYLIVMLYVEDQCVQVVWWIFSVRNAHIQVIIVQIIICNDGVSGPALQPTSRKMNGCNGVSAVPTVSPLPVTTYIVSNEVCNSVDNVMLKRLNTSFGYVLSGEYVYKGVYNGQAYYQKENNIGIYLWANVGPDWYYIGPDYTDNNLMAYCDIDTTTNSLKDCDIGHWHIDDNGWIIDSDATIKECNIGEISTTHIGSTDTTIDTTATAMDTTIDRPVCDSVNSVILSGLNSVLSVELNGEYIYQGQHLELPYYRYLKNANILLYVFERYNFYILGYNLNSSGLFAYCDSLIINDCTYGNWFYYNDGIDDFQINNGATIKKCDSDVIPSSTAIIDTTNKINTTSTFTPTITPTTEPIEGNNVLSHQKINYGFLRVLLCVLLGLLNANI
eukprot:540765_1